MHERQRYQPHYADKAWQGTAEVLINEQVARDTWRIRLTAPALARRTVPGQFAMLRLAETNDPLLGRPLAVYRVLDDQAGRPAIIELVYLVVGKMTGRLRQVRPGEILEAWGPLGNGFSTAPADHVVMIAGGIGQTPFVTLGQERLGRRKFGEPPRKAPAASSVTLCYGARSADCLACVDEFEEVGIDVRLATDDGSAGVKGFVTQQAEAVLRELLGNDGRGGASDASTPDATLPVRMAACGPEPMLQAVARLAAKWDVACEVSLETPMACGIGACYSCVAKIRQPDGTWDYRRTCVEGPIFDSRDIEF